MFDFNSKYLTAQIEAWLEEDLGMGDMSSLTVIPEEERSFAEVRAKQTGVVAGLPVAARVFAAVDASLEVKLLRTDGERMDIGDRLLEVNGSTRSILAGERLALNLLQRLSAIASKTAAFVAAIDGLATRIADTRKTTPGLRMLEKYAVRVGGGHNHRFGLFDAVMIKDNHIIAAGSIQQAIDRARAAIPHTMKIEVEVERLEQLPEALAADIIMLDNMALAEMREAVRVIRAQRPTVVIEASGNVSLETIRAIAETGVDVISIGAITHSAGSLDLSLDFLAKKESER